MSRIEEIDTRMEAIRSELADIAALPEPNEDDVARTDALLDENDTLTAEREPLAARAARVEAARAAIANPVNRENGFGAGVNVNVKQDPFENLEALRFVDPNSEDIIARAVTAISEVKSRGTSDAQRQLAVQNIENVSGAAVHALVHGSPAYRTAFQQFLRSQGSPLYTAEEIEAVRASMSLTGNAGGYMLPTLLDPTLIHTGTAAKNPLRSISRVVTGTQNVWHGVSVGNVTTYWVAENTALTDGSPTFASPSVTAAKLTAYVTASYEIFEDSSAQAQLPGLIAESMGFAESTAFITGSGSGAPKGIVTALSGTAGSTVTATTRGAFTTASAVDVFAVLNALPSRYEDTSTWVANKATFNTIKQMSTGSNGSYFWSDFNNTANGKDLLGSPTVQASDMATAQTSGTKLIVLGDFSQFVIFDRIGTMVEFIPNVVDGSGLPTGTRGLVAHKRVGSDVTDVNAFRVLNT